jgi:hypothetical protein
MTDTNTNTLTGEFAPLQPFVQKWARSTEDERAAARRTATKQELQSFYDAVAPRIPALLDRVDEYPMGQIEGADRILYYLLLSLVEVAPHVELYKLSPLVPHAFTETRMIARHGATAD